VTTSTQPAVGTVEYAQRTDIAGVQALAAQGWQLHSFAPFGGNIVYVMERQSSGPDGYDGQAWDDLREQYETERGKALRAGMERDEVARQLEEVAAERDQSVESNRYLLAERNRLAAQVQRVRDLTDHMEANYDIAFPGALRRALDGGVS